MTQPTLAVVETLYDQNFRDVAKTLRLIADEIDAGTYGGIHEAVLVLAGTDVEVFGLGAADSGTTHLLLHAAAHKMIRPLLDKR